MPQTRPENGFALVGNLSAMPEPMVSRLHEWLHAHESELLNDFTAMLKIPSLEGEPAPNAPFGPEPRRALDLALELSKRAGLKTKDMDGYVGYAETGQGKNLVVSLGHLDVVPVGPGWKHEPFGAEVDEGYIYARGATDDKGATMASFYAVRALHECVPGLPSRVRQIFGCNEESGFRCIHHYAEHEELPTFGVAPDASWPLVHGEKGIARVTVSVPLYKGDVELLEVAGGQRVNIVVDSCSGALKVNVPARKHVEPKLADQGDANVTWKWDGDVLRIQAKGKAAHGSTPFMGDSAVTRLFRFLLDLTPLAGETYFEELLNATQVGGQGLGVHGNDEPSKDLTSNAGIVSTKDGRLHISYSLRCPVTWKGSEVEGRISKYLPTLKSGWKLESFEYSDGLYFPLDHPLVKTIREVAKEELGIDEEPHVMGGGTYARAIPNTVAIGAGFEGDGKAHETDERIAIESLFKLSRAYAALFYRLAMI